LTTAVVTDKPTYTQTDGKTQPP